jgi:DDE_Tnp_1-associated
MNDPLIEMLSCVTDCRRKQAKRYRLANILMFCILDFLCGAKSYKTLCSFIEARFALLQAAFPSTMTRAPAPSTLWRIIGLVDGATLERCSAGMLCPSMPRSAAARARWSRMTARA